tara:strand:- start:1209 stop:1940 length:732 start_codon:yes stop_codon:yes gene_type:complete
MEFNYMILQAYDFLELNKTKNCLMQIGGSDQWGNIVNGVELVKRYSAKQVFGLTTPLITLASGTKMGKTEKGAIWLDAKLLSSYDYWQFWRNTDDRDVLKFLKMFTDLDLKKIEKLKNEDINKLKKILANEATSMLHGHAAALKAEKTAEATFVSGGSGADLPEINIEEDNLKKGIKILDLLSSSKIMTSKSEARRAIKGNALKIDNKLLSDENKIIGLKDFDNKKNLKISFGKKKHYLIKII